MQVLQLLAFPKSGSLLQSAHKNFMVNMGAVDPWSSVVDGKNVMHFAVLHRQANIVKLLGENGFLSLAEKPSTYEEIGPHPRTPIEELLLSPADYRSMRGFLAYFAQKGMLTFKQWETASAHSMHAETKRWRRELLLDKAFGEKFSDVHQVFLFHVQPRSESRCRREQATAAGAELLPKTPRTAAAPPGASCTAETQQEPASPGKSSPATTVEKVAMKDKASPTSTALPSGSPDSASSSIPAESPPSSTQSPSLAEHPRLGTLYDMIRNPRCTAAGLTKFLDTVLMIDNEVLDGERGSEGSSRSVDKSLRVKCAFAALIFGRNGVIASGRVDLLRGCFAYTRNWPQYVWAARLGLARGCGEDNDRAPCSTLATLECGESLRPFLEAIRRKMSLEVSSSRGNTRRTKKEHRVHEYEYEQGVDLLRLATSLYYERNGETVRLFDEHVDSRGADTEPATGEKVRRDFLDLFNEMVDARACSDELRDKRLCWRIARIIERGTRKPSADDEAIRDRVNRVYVDANARVAALSPAARKLYQEDETSRLFRKKKSHEDYRQDRRHEAFCPFPISPTSRGLVDFIQPQKHETTLCGTSVAVPIPVGESLYSLAVARGHPKLADWFLELEVTKDHRYQKALEGHQKRTFDEMREEADDRRCYRDDEVNRPIDMYMSLPTAVHRVLRTVCDGVFKVYHDSKARGSMYYLQRCQAVYSHLATWLETAEARNGNLRGIAARQQFPSPLGKELLSEFVYVFGPEDNSCFSLYAAERSFLEVVVWMVRDTLGKQLYGKGCEFSSSAALFKETQEERMRISSNSKHDILEREPLTLETAQKHADRMMCTEASGRAGAPTDLLAYHIARVCSRQLARNNRQRVLEILDWVLAQPGVHVNASGGRFPNGLPKEYVVEEARQTLERAEEQGHTVRSTASGIPAFRCKLELTSVKRPILFSRSLFDISDLPTSFWLMRELIKRGADPKVRGILSGRKARHEVALHASASSVRDRDVAEPVPCGTLIEQILRVVFAKNHLQASWDAFVCVGGYRYYDASHERQMRQMLGRDEETVAEMRRRAVEDRDLDWEVSSASDIDDDGDQICGPVPVVEDGCERSGRAATGAGPAGSTSAAACGCGQEQERSAEKQMGVAELLVEEVGLQGTSGQQSASGRGVNIHAPPRIETGERVAIFGAAAEAHVEKYGILSSSSRSDGDDEDEHDDSCTDADNEGENEVVNCSETSSDDFSSGGQPNPLISMMQKQFPDEMRERLSTSEEEPDPDESDDVGGGLYGSKKNKDRGKSKRQQSKRRPLLRFPSVLERELKNCHILQEPEQYTFRKIEALPPESSGGGAGQGYEVLAPGRRQSRTAAILEKGGVAELLKPIAGGAARREMYTYALRIHGARGIRSLQRHLYLSELEHCLQHCEPIRNATPSQQRSFVMNFKMKKRILSLYDVIEWLAMEHDVDIQCLNVKHLLDAAENKSHNKQIPLPITQKQIDQLKRTQATKRLSLLGQTSVEQNKDSCRKTTGSFAKKANKK